MKLREIVKLSAIMLNLEDILNSDKLYDETFDITNEQEVITNGTDIEKNFNLLIRCFNLVYSEIATDYFPLITIEDIVITNGSLSLDGLSKKFYKFIKLEDQNSLNVRTEIYDNVLYAKDGHYKLIYCYIPEKVSLNSEISSFNGKLVDRIFAYGLNKEYCYISGLYNEAESYKSKFEEGLKTAYNIKKNLVLPRRRWN